MKSVVKNAGKCELCGSLRSLEAHHIIPVVFDGDDTLDNLICVCHVCHEKLTPHSLLSKHGQKKSVEKHNAKMQFKIDLYNLIQKKIDNGDYAFDAVLDAIEEM